MREKEPRRSARIKNQPPKHRRSSRITDLRLRDFTEPDTDMSQIPDTNQPKKSPTIEVTIYSNLTPEKHAEHIECIDNDQPIEPPKPNDKPNYSYFANLKGEKALKALNREKTLLISDRLARKQEEERKMLEKIKEIRRIRKEERRNRLKTIKSN